MASIIYTKWYNIAGGASRAIQIIVTLAICRRRPIFLLPYLFDEEQVGDGEVRSAGALEPPAKRARRTAQAQRSRCRSPAAAVALLWPGNWRRRRRRYLQQQSEFFRGNTQTERRTTSTAKREKERDRSATRTKDKRKKERERASRRPNAGRKDEGQNARGRGTLCQARGNGERRRQKLPHLSSPSREGRDRPPCGTWLSLHHRFLGPSVLPTQSAVRRAREETRKKIVCTHKFLP